MGPDSNKPWYGILTELDERRKIFLMGLVLALVTFMVFAPAIQFRFLNYDDNRYVFENRHVLGGLSWSGLVYAFTTIDVGNWMPLTWLSLQLDATLYGNWAAGYHFTNILLHCGSVLWLFLALERMTKAFWRSALVALLFAIHPLRQESVVWIAERKGALSTFFWMLGLLAYVRYAEKRSLRRYGTVALCLVLGLLSKTMLVTFPFALLLLDFWPLQRFDLKRADLQSKFWPLFLEKIPLMLLCGVMLVINFLTLTQAGGIAAVPSTFIEKILHACDDYVIYLRHIIWPVQLATPYPMETISWTRGILSGGLVLGISIASLCLARSFRWLAVGWFWYLITFIPVIGLVHLSHTFVADRYSYVPFIGVALLAAWGLGSLGKRSPAWQRAASLASVVLCLATITANHASLFRWKDSVSLFSDSIRKGLHPVACNNLAAALNGQGKYTDALAYAQLAIKLQSTEPKPDAYINCGVSLAGLGEFDQAIQDYTAALDLDPHSSKAHLDRGQAYVEKRDFKAALADFSRAIELDPDSDETWNNRASAWCSLSNYNAALADFSRAIELDPDSAEAWNNRAFAWCSLSNYNAALADCTRAVQLDPHKANGYIARGNVFSSMGDFQRAVADYSLAITLNPKLVIAYNNRAAAYLGLKELNKARADIQSCEQLGGRPRPDVVEALLKASRQR